MILVIALQGIIIIVLLIFIFIYKKDIKYISDQIVDSKGEYSNIRMRTMNKEIEALVSIINGIYEENQKVNVQIKDNEEKLKKSIANISHDLRTPLTSIMGYMQLLKENNIIENEKIKYFNIIEKRTKVLQDLITSFYELSRIESDEYKFNLKSINLSNILCEAIAVFYEDFTSNNIEPHVNVEDTTSVVIADEKAVMRVFSNLINNMLKHGEKNIGVSLKREDGKIVTEFINDAHNLKDEDMEYIFERFFTADLTRSDKNTGLGLSITKSLVEQMGYNIDASLVNGLFKIRIIWS